MHFQKKKIKGLLFIDSSITTTDKYFALCMQVPAQIIYSNVPFLAALSEVLNIIFSFFVENFTFDILFFETLTNNTK